MTPRPLLLGHPLQRPAAHALERGARYLSPKVPGSAKLNEYWPIALGKLEMKLLTGPLTQLITEVLTRHGLVSDWQQGALPAPILPPPLFMYNL